MNTDVSLLNPTLAYQYAGAKTIHKNSTVQNGQKGIDGQSNYDDIRAKAKEFEEVFIADSLKHAKLGMSGFSMGDTTITDTFSTFMNKSIAEIIVSQGGIGLTDHITQSMIKHQQQDIKSPQIIPKTTKGVINNGES